MSISNIQFERGKHPRMFREILSISPNIVMDLNNDMNANGIALG